MRISDWSSDLCSSDLTVALARQQVDVWLVCDGAHIAPHHVGHVRAPLDDVVGGRRGYRRLFDRLRRLFLVARCQRQHETGNKQDLQYASRDVRGEVFHGAPLDGWLEVGTHASIRCHSACSALSTAAGTNAETSPPRRAISRPSADEMKQNRKPTGRAR